MTEGLCGHRWTYVAFAVHFMICAQLSESLSLSITKDQELQQPDFSIAIWPVHAGNTQLGPSDKATRELWMSLPTSTSYLNNAVCVKVQRSISAVVDVKWHNGCQVIFPTEINKKITTEKPFGVHATGLFQEHDSLTPTYSFSQKCNLLPDDLNHSRIPSIIWMRMQ